MAMERVPRLITILGCMVLGTSATFADDVQVNTYTTGDQGIPKIARAADGSFVVVWSSDGSAGTDDSVTSIQARRFAGDGSPIGDDFQVNTYTPERQNFQNVAMGPDGAFVIVWASEGSPETDDSETSIQAQIYAANGTALNSQFQVNSYTTGFQREPAVAIQPNGDFIIVWHSEGSNGADIDSSSILGQRYSSGGFPISGEFEVNDYTTSGASVPDIATDVNGDFIVTWTSGASPGSDNDSTSIQVRRFAADGTQRAGQFQANTSAALTQRASKLAIEPDLDFVVVWQGRDGDYSGIHGQRFDSNGSPVGVEFQANTYITGAQFRASVEVEADGDFVVVWSSYGSFDPDINNQSIQMRRYASDGSTTGREFQVNTVTVASQTFPDLVLDDASNPIVVWGSRSSAGTDPFGGSIQKTPPGPVFSDSFESGDTSAWSAERAPSDFYE